jgi:hypothetical protein
LRGSAQGELRRATGLVAAAVPQIGPLAQAARLFFSSADALVAATPWERQEMLQCERGAET